MSEFPDRTQASLAPESSPTSRVEATPRISSSDAADTGYAKRLKSRHIQMIAIGGAIGTGLFLGSSGRMLVAGPSLAIVYTVCGFFALLVVRALGELALYRPSSGAFVSYAREFFGEKGAYSAGWLYFLDWSATLVADITAVALYVQFWSVFIAVPQWMLALIALFVVLTINLLSVNIFGEVEFWFSIIKVGAILLFAAIAIVVLATGTEVGGHTPGLSLLMDNGGIFPNGPGAMLAITLGVMFAFAGIEMVGISAGESENPAESIPKAVKSVVWRIALFYVGSIVLLSLLVPWNKFNAGVSPFVTVLDGLGIPYASDIMNIVVVTAAMSSLNAGLYASGRTLRSLSIAGTAPRFAKRISQSGVPYGGILLTGVVGIMGVFLNWLLPEAAFEIVLNLSGIGTVAAWAAIMLCHWKFVRHASRGDFERPALRLWCAPVSNAVTLVFLVLVIALIGLDGAVGRLTLSLFAVVVVLMVIGWYAVRNRIDATILTQSLDLVNTDR